MESSLYALASVLLGVVFIAGGFVFLFNGKKVIKE